MIFSPPSEVLLNVPHLMQKNPGECLAACASMVCEYNGVSIRYNRIVRTLETIMHAGTAFYNIEQLTKLNIQVYYQKNGSLENLYEFLQGGWPCIVGVETYNLPHWQKVNTPHAVVVIGMAPQHIYLNDPAFPQSIFNTSLGEFDLAWFEKDEEFAVLGTRK
ncbi:MAG: C39 family peptidase [Chloroflexota bacterium]